MLNRFFGLLFLLTVNQIVANAQAAKTYEVASPQGRLTLKVDAGTTLQWSVRDKTETLLAPSPLSLQLQGGEVLGHDTRIASAKTEKVNATINATFYKKSTITDSYNQLTINYRSNYGVIFRVYDEGVAYRFFTKRPDSLTVQSEEAAFAFTDDFPAYIPYSSGDPRRDPYTTSFESLYQHARLSGLRKDTLAFTPVLVELNGGKKAVITEADLEAYPGMFLQVGTQPHSLTGRFAPYPTQEKQGGHNNLQSLVTQRANFLARTAGTRSFPWRVVIFSEKDQDLLDTDLVYKLAAPSRVSDVSWIKPGKVAWDWWNDWNISGVDFQAGINTATYKYYIDFASANGIEYILLDEGWANSLDILKIVPEIDLQAIIDYGKQKNVGVWLWGGWLPLDKKMDEAMAQYARMGIKGFKVDFMDRDDQKMVEFHYRCAQKAAQYHLMVDFHGTYKPTGLQRTYPNVVNFEGVRGLENVKWSNTDFPGYDVTIPYTRMVAGPMDYTPGAMKNANQRDFRAINSAPMSQGTRCHQLAMYVVFESPFEMLADTPTNYMQESESVKFIASVPTVFEQTVPLAGSVGQSVAIARRKGTNWYVGAMTNWDARDLTLDLSFLGSGTFEAEIFQDGLNAQRDGTDYKRVVKRVSAQDKLTLHMAPGGGWAARIYPVR